MNSFTRVVGSILLGGWALLVLLSHAVAETSAEVAAPDTRTARSSWEQRVLGGGHGVTAGPHATTASGRLGRRGSPRRQGYYLSAPVELVSAEVESGGVVDPSGLPVSNVEVIPPGQRVSPSSMEEEIYGLEAQGPPGQGFDSGLQGCATCGGTDCGACYDTCYGTCWGDCGGVGCGPCGPPWAGFWGPRGWWLRNFSIFGGVHGFKGPPDQGENGNFGFHEGVNFGAPLGGPWGVGYQLGFQAVHSNFSGNRVNGQVQGGDRDQLFFTAGVFRRAVCGGLQWGVAFDLLHDSYYDTADLKQVRAELALVRPGCREIGFWGAFGTGDDEFILLNRQVNNPLEPTDLFAIFYRRYFSGGGQGRVWTGLTGAGDAVFGADCTVPLGTSWALENNFSYLIPEEGSNSGGQQEESWSVMIQLVWYPGRPARCALKNAYHPLFNVADNSVFMVDVPQP